ncbi:ABSCISIC ACID-INSENSITIVE 5-like protein 2 isoform X2 [Phoenix dactylifera]|uniref:ABSCISIC ACID-INSENSITIVE 5-like protein 2 isoform X2 n=1 Tax=Phoenix dactylifera TaxID=42345 RepID=A0A8B9AC10_PHODC|nr:ABSCISIC ACID-INSENSITIVE 5-like protein 2 isoform X2 [Phoenix dactylifera]
MGIQTMGSQGSGGTGEQRSEIQSLARQGSLYCLTLNEVQNHLGEPLSSMNLDELLKSVFPESNQSLGMNLDCATSQYTSGSGLQRQGSITMPRALSKKTVDEVWRDIQQVQQKSNEEQRSGHGRQLTLGEMTLEDFLVKAGVVVEGSAKDANDIMGNVGPGGSSDPMAGVQDFGQRVHWLQQYHQMAAVDQQQQGQQSLMGAYVPSHPVPQPLALGVGTSPILDAVFPDGQLNISSPGMGAFSDPQTPGRKRAASGDMLDKLMERRQKRMIKNRESAARSRARKQAYTNELEHKVSRLEEENERLKKQKGHMRSLSGKSISIGD